MSASATARNPGGVSSSVITTHSKFSCSGAGFMENQKLQKDKRLKGEAQDGDRNEESGHGHGCCTNEGLEGRLPAKRMGSNEPLDTESSKTSDCNSDIDGQSDDCDSMSHARGIGSYMAKYDCKTCCNHASNHHNNPRAAEMRDRLRRDHDRKRKEEQFEKERREAFQAAMKASNQLKSIPCGKKEHLIIVSPANQNETVDDLVRKIEGGTGKKNDPKKIAKKERQRQKKVEMKLEEDRLREEEERRIREEEERLRREQEEKEEEERKRAEDLKRQAKKQKKKNRKRREAEKGAESVQSESKNKPNDPAQPQSLSISNVNASTSPSESVRKMLETMRPPGESGEKTKMVTIRRHPTMNENQNVVSITLEDNSYMLVNGQLVTSTPIMQTNPIPSATSEGNEQNEKGKKKKKKSKAQTQISHEQPPKNVTNLRIPNQLGAGVSLIPLNDGPRLSSRPREAECVSPVDIEKLNLPAGITITKLTNTGTNSARAQDILRETQPTVTLEKTCTMPKPTHENSSYYYADDDDFFAKKENEEFEKVMSRRKRTRTNKHPEGDGEDVDARESPTTSSSSNRRTFISDSEKWNGNNRPPKGVQRKPMARNDERLGMTAGAKPRWENHSFRPNNEGSNQSYQHHHSRNVPLIPRYHRTPMKNAEACYQSPPDLGTFQYRPQSHGDEFKISSVPVEASTGEGTFGFTNERFSSGQHHVGVGELGGFTQAQSQWATSRPVTHQNAQEAWTPWKTSWSETSTPTPENPSPHFAFGDQPTNEAATKTYSFQNLLQTTAPSSKSPIQRPLNFPSENSTVVNGFGGCNTNDFFLFGRNEHQQPQLQANNYQQLPRQGNQQFEFSQNRQRNMTPSPFKSASTISGFGGLRNNSNAFCHAHNGIENKWDTVSGIGNSHHLQQRRHSDLPPQRFNSSEGNWGSGNIPRNQVNETTEQFHRLAMSSSPSPLSPTTNSSLHSGFNPAMTNLGSFAGKPLPGNFQHEWLDQPRSTSHFQKLYDEHQQGMSYNWDLGYNGGGAV